MEELVLEKNLKLTKLQITGFNKLGIYSVKDLLYHFPVRFLENSDEFNGVIEKRSIYYYCRNNRENWKKEINGTKESDDY